MLIIPPTPHLEQVPTHKVWYGDLSIFEVGESGIQARHCYAIEATCDGGKADLKIAIMEQWQ